MKMKIKVKSIVNDLDNVTKHRVYTFCASLSQPCELLSSDMNCAVIVHLDTNIFLFLLFIFLDFIFIFF